MATTAVIPSYQLNGTDSVKCKVPDYVLDAAVVAQAKLPTYVADASPISNNRLPTFMTQLPLEFSLTATGGAVLGGDAYIVGDPLITLSPTGGSLLAGSATVAHTYVLNLEFYPRGGSVLSGTAAVIYDPRKGVALGGAATVSAPLAHIVTGGGIVGGEATVADILPVTATGGMSLYGAGEVTTMYAVEPPTGGISLAGSGGLVLSFSPEVSGGIYAAGAATVTDKYPVYTPSGGVRLTGASVAFAVPKGGVVTAENPYNAEFNGWALNYETNAPSRYERLAANSICRLDGVTYVANAGGIYALGADDDAGQEIQASVSFGNHDFGTHKSKRVASVYLGLRSAYKMKMSLTANKKTVYYYDVEPPKAHEHGSRLTPAKGLSGLFFGFRLENQRGAYFELDAVTLELAVSSRMGV